MAREGHRTTTLDHTVIRRRRSTGGHTSRYCKVDVIPATEVAGFRSYRDSGCRGREHPGGIRRSPVCRLPHVHGRSLASLEAGGARACRPLQQRAPRRLGLPQSLAQETLGRTEPTTGGLVTSAQVEATAAARGEAAQLGPWRERSLRRRPSCAPSVSAFPVAGEEDVRAGQMWMSPALPIEASVRRYGRRAICRRRIACRVGAEVGWSERVGAHSVQPHRAGAESCVSPQHAALFSASQPVASLEAAQQPEDV